MAAQAANPANGPVAANPKANPGLLDSGNTAWTRPDIKRLLDFLVKHQAEAGDGGKFQTKDLRCSCSCCEFDLYKGRPKKLQIMSAKIHRGLRKEWLIVDNIKDTSGYPWDDEKGVKVTAPMRGTWTEFANVHKGAACFEGMGWPYYDLMVV
ncbi:hypothetical protein B0H10DRAFT_1939893 [Mycena sp. CBHHK59/15]|nr:hypothetical protein B0H10DRAFT_1939893 [Mycena sp. CBHHK59/15]